MQPVKALVGPVPVAPGEMPDPAVRREVRAAIRALMWRDVGLVRSKDSVQRALAELAPLTERLGAGSSESHNLLTVAEVVANAALARRDSRGAHFRTDDLLTSGSRHEMSGRPR
jgi:aspartate oxidase